jgi:AAA lid domain
MKAMLRDCNPGLKRRFKSDDAFIFADYSDDELAVIMVERAEVQKVFVTHDLAESCVRNVLAKQKAKQHFGNVGSVNNLLESAKEKMMQRYCTALIMLFFETPINIHYTSTIPI